MLNVFKANSFTTLFMFLLSKYTFKIFGLSNSLLLIDFILSNILIGSSRIGVRIFFNQIYDKNSNKEVKHRKSGRLELINIEKIESYLEKQCEF